MSQDELLHALTRIHKDIHSINATLTTQSQLFSTSTDPRPILPEDSLVTATSLQHLQTIIAEKASRIVNLETQVSQLETLNRKHLGQIAELEAQVAFHTRKRGTVSTPTGFTPSPLAYGRVFSEPSNASQSHFFSNNNNNNSGTSSPTFIPSILSNLPPPLRYPSPDQTTPSATSNSVHDAGFSSDSSASGASGSASPPKAFNILTHRPTRINSAPVTSTVAKSPKSVLLNHTASMQSPTIKPAVAQQASTDIRQIADKAIHSFQNAQDSMKEYSRTGYEHIGYYAAFPDAPFEFPAEGSTSVVPLIQMDPFLNNYKCMDLVNMYRRANPCLADLETFYGTRWRQGRFHFWYRVNGLVKAIEQEVEKYMGLEGVAEEYEDEAEGEKALMLVQTEFCEVLDSVGTTFALATSVMRDARFLERQIEFVGALDKRFTVRMERGAAGLPSPKRAKKM
ncbi:hypothetical protein BJ741DRAFT_612975 [Chytriomyces cf. hyalinus JEL632]|nr:hypothetical protein BJ741DRAFT_612975 [Chytriomyces cf. hyalinus JEL632]